MVEGRARQKPKSRIEGGIDVVVVGAGFEGLCASALLARAGMKTVLVSDAAKSQDVERREFFPGYYCIDGEHLLHHLDARLAETLDLYRHGLQFSQRRMDTSYRFSDGGLLLAAGDLTRIHESVAAVAPKEAADFAAFLEGALDAARAMRPFFDGAEAPDLSPAVKTRIEPYLVDSVDRLASFQDPHVRAMIAAEALMRRSVRIEDPMGAAALLERWSGEVAGMQGAIAYPDGGSEGLLRAARRAAQAADVDLRPAVLAKRILVERDRAAGVEAQDGVQLRALAVVVASPARTAFIDLVGASLLDAEFQSTVDEPDRPYAAAQVNFALGAVPKSFARDFARRLVYAPSDMELGVAFSAARGGCTGSPTIMEAIAPSLFDRALAPKGGACISALVHPAPGAPEARDMIAQSARDTLERIAPGLSDVVVAIDVRTAADDARLRAFPTVVEAWGRSRRLQTASGIGGFFFCGPETQTGPGLSGACARRAAEAAVQYLREIA